MTTTTSVTRTPNSDARIRRAIEQLKTSVASAGNLTVLDWGASFVGNTAATETNLVAYTLPGGTVASTGESIEFRAAGQFASSASTDKRIRVTFGGIVGYDTGVLATAGTTRYWTIHGSITRASATSVRYQSAIFTSYSGLPVDAIRASLTVSLGSDQLFRITGNGTNASDVLVSDYKIWFLGIP